MAVVILGSGYLLNRQAGVGVMACLGVGGDDPAEGLGASSGMFCCAGSAEEPATLVALGINKFYAVKIHG